MLYWVCMLQHHRSSAEFEVLIQQSITYFCRPGGSTQPIWLNYFSCGTYSGNCLDTCTSCPTHGITSCSHSSDITVQCGESYSSKYLFIHQDLLKTSIRLYVYMHTLLRARVVWNSLLNRILICIHWKYMQWWWNFSSASCIICRLPVRISLL